jgi:RimJ/RimL family protein N-acetyltransferase/8-oxo-dGTP pyrophosphatase MutT (NUDIX family)
LSVEGSPVGLPFFIGEKYSNFARLFLKADYKVNIFMDPSMITTQRLILRPWKEADFDSFAQLNADPSVMEYFPGLLSRKESDRLAERICLNIKEQGWGFWAVSIPDVADFIGFIGLAPVKFVTDFTPAIEVGWRLAYDFWNKGYATEGARAALKYGFETLRLDEIVSFTAMDNRRSRHVMEKIGMYHDEKSDFDHPKLPEEHPLRRHALYRIKTGHFTQISESQPENFQSHIEVSACYIEIGGEILLMKRSLSSVEGGTWGVPAGKLEAGETPYQAAIRELFEETQIRVSPLQITEIGKLYVQKPRGTYIYHMFQVHLNEKPHLHLSHEHTEYLWANPEQIEALDLVGGGKESLDYYARTVKNSIRSR